MQIIAMYSSAITLTEPDSINLTLEVTQPFCPDKPDGEITINCYRWCTWNRLFI